MRVLGPDVQNATPKSGVQFPALVTGLRDQVWAMVWFHRTDYRLPGRHFPFLRAAPKLLLWAVALAGYLLCFGSLYFSGRRNITGAYEVAIGVPFKSWLVFSTLVQCASAEFLDYGRIKRKQIPKNITSLFSIASGIYDGARDLMQTCPIGSRAGLIW